MVDLNTQQFLPGMEQMTPDPAVRPPEAHSATPGGWSGQLPGQLVMGVQNATHGQLTSAGDFTPHKPFEIDKHGFIREEISHAGTPVPPSPDKATGNPSVHQQYREVGGVHAGGRSNRVTEHWANQPLRQINSDTPVHTGQAAETTENKLGGRDRIDKIRESLRSGEEIQKPAWMIKQSGRLFAMDGHHRITASREEGKPTYPARVWDIDSGIVR